MRRSPPAPAPTTFPPPGTRRTSRAPQPRVERVRTILLVDPHADTLAVYGAVLRHHGFRVLEARDGAEGARLFHEHRPQLVVMELHLPEADGWRLLEQLRSDPAPPPVLAVTASIVRVTRAQALARGFTELLPKPCSPQRVLEEVRKLTS